MASKPKRNGRTETEATTAPAATWEIPVGSSSREDEIRRRAYEIYLERGEEAGRELDDWLQAERELEYGMMAHQSFSRAPLRVPKALPLSGFTARQR